MSNHDFSDRLLSAEQTTPAFREKYEKEIKAMLEKTLTPAQRFGWGFSTVMSAVSVVVFTWAAIVARELPVAFRAVLGFGALVGLIWAIMGGKIVLKGKMNRRTAPNAFTGMTWGLVLMVQIVILMVGGQHPNSVLSVFMAVYGLTFLLCGAMLLLTNRIDQTFIRAEEKFLQIELRLAEIAESLPKKQGT